MGTSKEFILIAVIGAILALILPLWFDVYNLSILVIYAMLALSLGFIWGFGGILCFGQAAFFGLGAYVFSISALNFGTPWGPFFLAIIIPGVVAFVFGAMLFYGKLSDVYLAVLTLVFTLFLFKFMNASAGEAYQIGGVRLGGFNGIPGFETLTLPWDSSEYLVEGPFFYFSFGLLLLAYWLIRWLLRSSFGRIVIGIRENELRAQLIGYDIRLIKTLSFTIGGMIAGLAGCLYANWAEIVTPNLFSLGQSAEIIIWVIVGGAGTLMGPMLGAVVLGYLKFLLGQQTMIDNTFILGLILVLAVLFLPRGLFPSIADLWLSATRRWRWTKPKQKRRRLRVNGHRETNGQNDGA